MILLRLTTLIAVFIFGFTFGAAVLNYSSGTYLDRAELEIKKLNDKLLDQTEQIRTLENNLSEQKVSTVNTIEIHIISHDEINADAYNNLEIEKKVKDLLKTIRGQEISSLDPLLVSNIIDRRTVTLSDHSYLLSVKGTLISEKLVMYIETREIIKPLSKNSMSG